MTSYICPICGYPELSEPHERSNDFCPSCSYQFGYHDHDQFITHEQWRAAWIAKGMVWDEGDSKSPKGWDPVKQLENIGVHIGIN